MDLIARNPYRILGVFANDTNKVRTANMGKIRAFLKVGKEVHFDIDVPNLLGSINRTQEMLDNAISLLSDETEAAIQALFWFHSDNEDTASLIEVLSKDKSLAGNAILGRKAVDMYFKSTRKSNAEETYDLEMPSYAKILNAAIISLATEDYAYAAICYELLIRTKYFSEFRKAISFLPPPQGSTSDKWLVQLFVECLTAEYPEVDWWQHFSHSGKRAMPHYLKDIFEKTAINKIKENIDGAKKEKPTKATEWLRIAQRLRRNCFRHIKVLQPCVGKTIQQQSALSQLPVDEQGNPDFEQAKDAGQAVDALVEMAQGSVEDARGTAELWLGQAQDALKKTQKAKAKTGASIAETMANVEAQKVAVAEAQKKVDFWQGVADEFKRREEAETQLSETTSNDGQMVLSFLDEAPNVLQLHENNTISAEGQLVLDELCKELIRECRLYYKVAKSDNEESVLPTLQLVDYALLLASSSEVKEKATAFKKELDQDVQKLPPKEVKEEARNISNEIKAFCWKPDEIQWSIQLVKNCFPYLKAIKEKLGRNNAYYIAISTRIADNAMYNSVNELKRVESEYSLWISKSFHLKLVNTLRKAWELLLYFQQMHLSVKFCKEKLQWHVEAVQQKLKQYNVKYSDITISESLLTKEELLIKRGDYASLVQFCTQHPESPYAKVARQKIRQIEISAFPKQITVKNILAYKERYPNTHMDATVLEWMDYFLPQENLWTADDYRRLLKLYPNHSGRLMILNRIPDSTAFEKCRTIEDYKKYLADFPHGGYREKALDEIEYRSCHTITELNRYIIHHPHGKHREEATRKIEDLIYASVIKSGKFDEYFQRYPNGNYVADLRKREEDAFYKSCKNRKDYEEYLKKYPNGCYVAAAKDSIKELQSKEDRSGCLYYWGIALVIGVVVIIISVITSVTDIHSEETDVTQITAIEEESFETDDNISSEELECDDVESEEVENEEAHSLDKTTTTDLSLFDPGRRNSLVKTIPDVPMLLLPEEVEKWGKNRLSTGATPYKSHFGEALTGDIEITFKTNGDCDYVVIIKKSSDDKYINHIYIRGGEEKTLYLPEANVYVKSYSGKGWNPNKKKGNLTGGFVSKESYQITESKKLMSGWVYECTLNPVQNGNMELKSVSEEEFFEE